MKHKLNAIQLRPVTDADWLKFHAAHQLPQGLESFLKEQQARPAEQRIVAQHGKTALGIIELVPISHRPGEYWLSLNPYPNVDMQAWVVAFCEVAEQAIAWGHKRVWLLVSQPAMRNYYLQAGYLSGGVTEWMAPDGQSLQAEWFGLDGELLHGHGNEAVRPVAH